MERLSKRAASVERRPAGRLRCGPIGDGPLKRRGVYYGEGQCRPTKNTLSFEVIDSQTALELPERRVLTVLLCPCSFPCPRPTLRSLLVRRCGEWPLRAAAGTSPWPSMRTAPHAARDPPHRGAATKGATIAWR